MGIDGTESGEVERARRASCSSLTNRCCARVAEVGTGVIQSRRNRLRTSVIPAAVDAVEQLVDQLLGGVVLALAEMRVPDASRLCRSGTRPASNWFAYAFQSRSRRPARLDSGRPGAGPGSDTLVRHRAETPIGGTALPTITSPASRYALVPGLEAAEGAQGQLSAGEGPEVDDERSLPRSSCIVRGVEVDPGTAGASDGAGPVVGSSGGGSAPAWSFELPVEPVAGEGGALVAPGGVCPVGQRL